MTCVFETPIKIVRNFYALFVKIRNTHRVVLIFQNKKFLKIFLAVFDLFSNA